MPKTLFGDYPEHQVYLLQYGDEPIYKIGYTKRLGARLCEINLALPYEVTSIYVVFTDDPRWLEGFWHHRFRAKRRVGSGRVRLSEWFDLTQDEVQEFQDQPEIVRRPPDEPKPLDYQLCFDSYLETEEQQNEENLWDASAKRVIEYFDTLISKHPQHVIKLSNACSHQIKDQSAKVGRLVQNSKHWSLERAISNWEREAKLSADAKVSR